MIIGNHRIKKLLFPVKAHVPAALVCFALVAGIWAFFAFDLGVKTVKAVVTPPAAYDTRATTGTAFAALSEFNEPVAAVLKDVTIHFKMMAYAINPYNNVFQTSDNNDGLRFEVAAPHNVMLVEGGDILTILPVMEQLQTHTWYDIVIKLQKSGKLQIFVDGVRTVKTTVSPATRIDRAVVGAGFSGTRRFDGRVEDFTMNYKLQERYFTTLFLFIACCFALLALIERQAAIGLAHRLLLLPIKAIRNDRLFRRDKILMAMNMIVVGFFCMTAFFYWKALILNQPWPDNTFLPAPDNVFCDFIATVGQWSDESFKGIGLGLSYFPSTYLIASFFSFFYNFSVKESVFLFSAIFLSFNLIYSYCNLKSERKIESFLWAFICTFMTYPVIFTFFTGNFEAFIFIFICFFIALYQRGEFALSAIPLAMAISMKLFPAVFLVLFIADKKYKALVHTVIWGLFFTLVPLLVFDGGIRDGLQPYIERLLASQKLYFDTMIIHGAGNYFGHSLLNTIWILTDSEFLPMALILKLYSLFALICFLLVSAYVVFIEPVFWKRVALMVICLCLLPYTSNDYKLLHFFIPLFLFINYRDEGNLPVTFDRIYILFLSLLIIPKSYFGLHGMTLLNINNVVNCFCMIVLLLTIILSGLDQHVRRMRLI